MHSFWEKVEHYNARLIAPALVVLFGIIIYEIFLHSENHIVDLIVSIADYLVISIFVVDLVFLAKKAKSVKFFFKNHWLDILAVFPFVLFFSLMESVYRIFIATERLTLGQALLHESVEAGRGAKALAEGGKFARTIRIIARVLRLVTKSRLFKKVHHGRRKKHTNTRQKQNKKIQ